LSFKFQENDEVICNGITCPYRKTGREELEDVVHLEWRHHPKVFFAICHMTLTSMFITANTYLVFRWQIHSSKAFHNAGNILTLLLKIVSFVSLNIRCSRKFVFLFETYN
jgi:hypothetical protein